MYVGIRDFTILWLGYKDVIDGAKDLDVKGIEVYVNREMKGDQYSDMGETVSSGFDFSTPQKRKAFIEKLESEGIKVCAFLVENDFARDDIEAEIKWVVDACKVASDLNVSTVRINAVMVGKQRVSESSYIKRTAECIKEIIRRTKGLDVSIAMENHGFIGNKKEFIEGVIHAVNSERMRLTLDTGNFYWYGYPLNEVYEIIEHFAPYVSHTHLKNLSFSKERQKAMREPGEDWPNSAAPLYEGDIDHARVINILRKAGYDGDLTIEDESLGKFPSNQRLDVIKKDIEHVKSLISLKS